MKQEQQQQQQQQPQPQQMAAMPPAREVSSSNKTSSGNVSSNGNIFPAPSNSIVPPTSLVQVKKEEVGEEGKEKAQKKEAEKVSAAKAAENKKPITVVLLSAEGEGTNPRYQSIAKVVQVRYSPISLSSHQSLY